MTLRRTRMLASGCSLVGVAALAAVLTAPPAVAERGPSGSAYALSVATTLLNQPLVKIDPRPTAVYPRGGSDSLVEVGPDAAGLVTANALNASSVLRGRTLISEAGIADVTVKNILSASLISADCEAGPSGVTGTSAVAGLTVLGQRIDVTLSGEIDVLGVAKVRVNEQIRTGSTLTVNAVHVIIGGPVGNITSADIVLAQAKCAWTGGTAPTTTPSTTTTTTSVGGTTSPSEPPVTGPSEPTSGTTTDRADATTTRQGVSNASNDEDLADTGASGILPISLTGLALLAGGGATMFVAKRRRAANQD
ncbi:choice-of-anchor P family protein [Actinophytocola glycyrrhizae]|uniref:Choice-of-anchor P family protein n=1 Tax=Actinophytocola glycyrrhizae TaxID=2044873 RepID=A0ABV9S5G9_9PSEU